MTQSPRILIVSDIALSNFPRAALEARGWTVTIAPDGDTALRDLLSASFDLVVADFGEHPDRLELIRRVRACLQLADILILSIAEWGTGKPMLALSAGADAYEPRRAESIDPDRLITSIERLLGRRVPAANSENL